jgi:hypothetical protein
MTDFEPEPQELPALARIHELVAKTAQDHGLIVRQFFIVPNINPTGPHVAHIVTEANPDFEKPVEATPDPEFEKVIREAEAAEREQKAAEARENLTKLRDTLGDRNKGIGLDD